MSHVETVQLLKNIQGTVTLQVIQGNSIYSLIEDWCFFFFVNATFFNYSVKKKRERRLSLWYIINALVIDTECTHNYIISRLCSEYRTIPYA